MKEVAGYCFISKLKTWNASAPMGSFTKTVYEVLPFTPAGTVQVMRPVDASIVIP